MPEKAPKRATAAVVAPKGFTGNLDGTISTELGQDTQLVSVSGEAGSAAERRLPHRSRHCRRPRPRHLAAAPLRRGRRRAVCEGELSAIDNAGFTGTCSLADGTTRTVQGTWSVSENAVHGQLTSKA